MPHILFQRQSPMVSQPRQKSKFPFYTKLWTFDTSFRLQHNFYIHNFDTTFHLQYNFFHSQLLIFDTTFRLNTTFVRIWFSTQLFICNPIFLSNRNPLSQRIAGSNCFLNCGYFIQVDIKLSMSLSLENIKAR